MAGTEGETRPLQPTLFVAICACWGGVVVLNLLVLLDEVCCWCLCLQMRCCLRFLRSSLWRTIYISILFDSLHRSKCHILGITTSSAKKLPHRSGHLNKGEEEMVFQYRGYGSWICVCRSSLWSLCFWDDMMNDVLYFGGLLYCWKFLMWYLHPGWSSVWWQFIISLINCSPPDVTVSRLPVQLPVQFCCTLYV